MIPYIAFSIFILNHMISVPERVLIFARSAEHKDLIMATCFIGEESNSKSTNSEAKGNLFFTPEN